MGKHYRKVPYHYLVFWEDENGKTGIDFNATKENFNYYLLSKEEHNNMLDIIAENQKLSKELSEIKTNVDSDEEAVTISRSEYNGLKKALRIVRDRALQQIDKSKVDEHGYRLLKANMKPYDELEACFITKSTPYSIKIPLAEARAIIESDLREFYNFYDLPTYKDSWGEKKHDTKELLKHYEYNFVNKEDYTKYKENNPNLYDFIEWMANHNQGKIAFKIERFTEDKATGCYEVSYWATDFV